MSKHTSAIAPWLGYAAQEYRLVQRLLKAKKGDLLGFEILDDVHEQSEGRLSLEQDKLSTSQRNIVSNQSKDLWKTLSNWLDLIKNEEINVSSTEFLLYTNKKHDSQALQLLINANNKESALSAYNELIELVPEPSKSIKKYVDNLKSFDDRKYGLIENFRYIYGSGSASQDLKSAYLEINTSVSEHSESILNEILGWTKNAITVLAERGNPTILSSSSFGKRLGEIESKYRQKTLLNFICDRANSDDDVQMEIKSQPTYVKQLSVIDIEETEIEEAVIAKLETKDAVSKWTVEGHIQESSYSKYSNTLKRKWNIQKNITYGQHQSITDIKKGQMLYYECLKESTTVKLENKEVDDFFSHGSLVELSDSEDIGWHPSYQFLLTGNIDEK